MVENHERTLTKFKVLMKEMKIDSQMVSVVKKYPEEENKECAKNEYLVEKSFKC